MMFKVNYWLCLAIMSLSLQNVYAETDEEINSALQKTQDCLKSQNCDAAKSSAGQAADQKALEAVGGDAKQKQAMYNISAEIMPVLIQQSGGDAEKMKVLIQKAQTDPQGFFNSLPPNIQAQIRESAKSVEKTPVPPK